MEIQVGKEKDAVLQKLEVDIRKAETEEDIEKLNAIALQALYSSEACVECGTVVSMLGEGGLCAYCLPPMQSDGGATCR